MKKQKQVAFNDVIEIIKASYLAFPKLWWRIAVVNITTVFFLSLGIILFGGILVLSMGIKLIQNIFINLRINPETSFNLAEPYLIWVGITLFLVINWILVFNVLGKIATFLTIKNYTKRKTENPLKIYFVKTWSYFWRYIGISFRFFWYIFWPLFLFYMIIGFLLYQVHLENVFSFILLIIISLPLLVWRSINSIFATSSLIHLNKSVSSSFSKALEIVKGNFWIVLSGILIAVVLSSFFHWLINVLNIVLKLRGIHFPVFILENLIF